jgi:AraC-like DNA-binding protein
MTERLGQIPSTAGALTRFACMRLGPAGIPVAPLLRTAGLSERQIGTPEARFDARKQIRVLNLVSEALNDPFLGFHLARECELGAVGLLYYVLASSQTMQDALRRAQRYVAIANEGIAIRSPHAADTTVFFEYTGVSRSSDRHQMEFLATALVRMCRSLTGQHVKVTRARFVHHRDDHHAELDAFLGCRAEFAADCDAVSLSNGLGKLAVTSADPHLNDLLVRYCEEAMALRNVPRGAFRLRVENAVVPLLPHGRPHLDEVSRRLGVSRRTLARRLASEGLSFARLLDELRYSLAQRYLMEQNLTISRIAWLLGYQETSAFSHAYKRWAGAPPRRARVGLEAVSE